MLGGVRRRFRDRYRKTGNKMNHVLAPIRRARLRRDDFTIISNNCWGSFVSRYYGLQYRSPTIDLYFFADDYVKFCSRLKYYTAQPLVFIQATESQHYDFLKEHHDDQAPIAKLGDIEIVFMHYASQEEAVEKWTRRCKRINWDNLLIKFSQMNECTEECLRAFDEIPFPRKVCFTAERDAGIRCGVFFKGYEGTGNIDDDTTFFSTPMDITRWVNSRPVTYDLG